jgi:histidyl-tRNA synthetase
MKITGVKGMNDLLPAVIGRWQEMERVAREVFALYGYREVRTPVVEPAALFSRSVGEATDIVKKEMYVFEDKGEEMLALRPEGTAGTVRAYVEHGCHVEGVQKWFYVGPMFRRERPQKGRYRQFHQIGCECFGIAEPGIDVEQIAMLDDYLGRLGVRAQLKLNTVGDASCRPAYLAELKAWLTARKDRLCADCNERIERNPLRVLDCKVESCQPVLAEAPRLLDRLCDGCRAHFDAVRAGLDALGVQYRVDPRLVRGLDYYVRTAYEFASDAIGAQSAVGGGGRYDGLVETVGGPATPGIGFGAGLERLLLALEREGTTAEAPRLDLFVAVEDPALRGRLLPQIATWRAEGRAVDTDYAGRSMKGQLTQAQRLGAETVVVARGDGTYEVRRRGEEDSVVADLSEI